MTKRSSGLTAKPSFIGEVGRDLDMRPAERNNRIAEHNQLADCDYY